MSVLCILPARIASERLPRKPLTLIAGRPLIEWSWRAACRVAAVDAVWVATDAEEVVECVAGFGGIALMTSAGHRSGTDRVAEAACLEDARQFDVVVNLQPDEPFVDPEAVSEAILQVRDGAAEISTLAAPIRSVAEWQSESVVKVVRGGDGRALYFSRAPIPRRRGGEPVFLPSDSRRTDTPYLQHLGVYVYTREALQRWGALSPSPLEEVERLEQLRPLEAGMIIHVVVTSKGSMGIDEPQDLARAEERLEAMTRNSNRE
jgi:3-deoxy-manno-octulosonate cytidylyltransferase (CMP-KDO synthetase)